MQHNTNQLMLNRAGSTTLGALGENFKWDFFLYLNINQIIYIEFFYLKSIFLAFWDAKLLIKFWYLSSSNISFSIDNIVNPLNLSYDIVDLK